MFSRRNFRAPLSSWHLPEANISSWMISHPFLDGPRHTCSLHGPCMANSSFPSESSTGQPRTVTFAYGLEYGRFQRYLRALRGSLFQEFMNQESTRVRSPTLTFPPEVAPPPTCRNFCIRGHIDATRVALGRSREAPFFKNA